MAHVSQLIRNRTASFRESSPIGGKLFCAKCADFFSEIGKKVTKEKEAMENQRGINKFVAIIYVGNARHISMEIFTLNWEITV